MRGQLMAAAVLLAAGPAAWAAEAPTILATPDWAKEPTGQQRIDAWPKNAMASGAQGMAILQCQVETDGKLAGCRVAEEAPAGVGFGPAALALAPNYQLRSRPTSGTVAFPERFTIIRRDFMVGSTKGTQAVNPIWAATPTASDVRAAYAPADRKATYIALQCGIELTGELRRCAPMTGGTKDVALLSAVDKLVPLFRANLPAVKRSDIRYTSVRLDIFFPSSTADWKWVVTQPSWTGSFGADQSAQVFPPQAADAGVKTGRAVLSCSADAKGNMSNCRILREEPADLGFGEAAMRLAPLMSVNPWTEYGLPAEGTEVRFALRLNQAEPVPAAPAGR